MKTIFASIILALVLPSTSGAQALAGGTFEPKDVVNFVDRLTPPLPTAGERKAADVASWVTALAVLALDTKASWDAPNRTRAFGFQAARFGITYGAVLAVKQMVGRNRPCAPDCGNDNADYSFYSGHTALAFQAVGGPRLAVALPLAISTGGLRVAAGRHWLTDTLVGAGAGLLTSRIR